MDLNALAKISTDGLIKMKEKIDEILESRLDTEIRVGRLATFVDGRHGSKVVRTILIHRINHRTVSGTETAGSVSPGHNWRVGIGGLTIVPEKRATPLPIAADAPHKPRTNEQSCW